MQYDDFIDRVQQRAGLDSQERAVRAVRATLETLGERLSRMETRQLAAQLPNQLRAHFHAKPESQLFPLEEFFKRVSARASVRQSEAAEQARAVIGVLREAVSAGEIEDVRIELAPDYDALFGEEPQEPLSRGLTLEELPLLGVFALDSPTRPNPIGLSLVRLVKRQGRRLVVEGIDVFDGTSILDIKGYSAGYRTESYTTPRWFEWLKFPCCRGKQCASHSGTPL